MLNPPPLIAEVASSARWGSITPRISVLVSTFRRPQYLAGLFKSIEAQDLDPSTFEVLIADNASGDDTWQCLIAIVAETRLAVRAVRVARNGGPATGRNAAVSESRAPLLAFTDDDCLAEPQWVATMLRALESGNRIVQGRTEPEVGVVRGTWDHTIAIRNQTTLFETCNLGYYRADVIEAGGFRPLPGYRPGRGGAPFGGEDTVLGWQITRSTGTGVTFASDAVVHHRIEPRDFKGWLHVRHGMGIFNALVASVPELRQQMFLRYFFSARSAAFDLGAMSIVAAAALGSVTPLVGLAPYAVVNRPQGRSLQSWARRLGPNMIGDAASSWSLVRGSLRQRRLLL